MTLDDTWTPSLTVTQRRVLTALVAHIQVHGYPPTVRELGAAVGIASTSSVTHQLRQLEYKGRIRRHPTKSRAIQIVGEQEAGHAPVEAQGCPWREGCARHPGPPWLPVVQADPRRLRAGRGGPAFVSRPGGDVRGEG